MIVKSLVVNRIKVVLKNNITCTEQLKKYYTIWYKHPADMWSV